MTILDRYILKEFLWPLLAGLCLFFFALAMDQLFGLLDLVLNRGIPAGIVLKLLGCLLPSIAAVAIPMATLLASALAFGRLAHDRELMAFKGAGVSLLRLSAPVVVFSSLLSAGLALFNGTALPKANAAYKDIFFSMVQSQATVALRERRFIRDFDQYMLYFDRREEPGGMLREIYIVEEIPAGPPRVITARRGRLLVDSERMKVKLVLEDGSAEQPGDYEGQYLSRVDFVTYEMNLGIQEALSGVRFFSKGTAEMDYKDLLAKIREFRNVPERRREFAIELHKRIAIAVATLLVTLVGVPLGSLARRGGGIGIMISLAVIFVYYFLLTMGQGWASRGSVPPWAGLWLPNLVLAFCGMTVFFVAMREARWSKWGR